MRANFSIPVYINYGQGNFFKTYNLFKDFLKTVPFEELQFQSRGNKFAGLIVSPRNNSGIPWCNITIALLYAYKKMPFKIILDDLNFLDPEWEDQLNPVEEIVRFVCDNLDTSYLKTSIQDDTDLDDADYKEIKRLSIVNGIWNVRNVVPSEKLDQYIKLSYKALEANAKKIKRLYSNSIFDHCVHQSLVNNNGGLHKWFGRKSGIRVGCLDMSMGRGLVGLKDAPGYHCDLPDIIENNMPEFLDSKENRRIAINEATKEHTFRIKAKDSRAYQVVSTDKSDTSVEVDILIPVNILWDAASLGRNRFFETPLCWLHETIDFILTNTTAQVVVRQHPAEREFELYGTGKKLGEYLQHQFRGHTRFRFISCNDNINTYLLIERCKVVLPYTSTVGIEAAMMGKKVILESSVYYKDQPFVVKANSKKDYFEKIKKTYEEFDTAAQALGPNQKDEIGWLLYFLLNKCSAVFSDFGLEPADFEKWTLKGFDSLSRDDNLMTAIEALISNKPFAYLNGKKILKQLKERTKRIIEWPLEKNEEIIFNLNQIICLINNNKYADALRLIQEMPGSDEIYLYPKALSLAKLNHFKEAQESIINLNILRPKHQYSRFLKNELMNYNNKSSNIHGLGKIEKFVIGIVSPSYSGSTLLAAILGAHSKIIAAGEVRWLIEREYFNVEKMIKSTADLSNKRGTLWQDDSFKIVNYHNLYESIFKVFKKYYVVDSSKDISHFKKITEHSKGNGISFLLVFLTKHPIRLLSSHMMHRWDKWEKLKNYNRNDAIAYLIQDIYNNLINIKKNLLKLQKEYKVISVKYEDIVNDTKNILNYLLREINLKYEDGMEKYYEKEQYIIGGNAGPRYHILKFQKGLESNIENPVQKEFYQNSLEIKMDNNYKKIFSDSEINKIYSDEKIQTLMKLLQYENLS